MPDARATSDQREPTAGNPYRTAAPPRRRPAWCHGEREGRWPAGAAPIVLLLLALLAWMGQIGWREHRLARELRALPATARHTLYTAALAELRSVCSVQPGLRDQCAREAALLLQLSECDADCRALARRFVDDGTPRR